MRIAWQVLAVAAAAGAAVWCARAEQPEPATATTTASAPSMPEGVQVRVAAVEETRRKLFYRTSSRWHMPTDLKLTLHVTGEVAAKAERFGRVELVRAKDDLGTDLVPRQFVMDRRQREGFVTIDDWKRRDVRNGFALELRLSSTPRAARRIAEVRGAFSLQVGGKRKHVVVPNVRARAGQEIADAILTEAGMKLRIHEETASGRKVSYIVQGSEQVLAVELVDASGKVVRSMGGWRQVGAAPRVYYRMPQGAMPEGVGLRLTVLVGAKQVRVPIVLKDIPLP